jgi:hypothetical protein
MAETRYATAQYDTAPAVCCAAILPRGVQARLYGRCEVIGRQGTGDLGHFERRHRRPRCPDRTISPTEYTQRAMSKR